MDEARAPQVAALQNLRAEAQRISAEVNDFNKAIEEASLEERGAERELEQASGAVSTAATAAMGSSSLPPPVIKTGRDDVDKTAEQLQELEISYQNGYSRQQEEARQLRTKADELQGSLELLRAKNRSANAVVLQRYRSAQAELQEAESRFSESEVRHTSLSKELLHAQKSLSAARHRVRRPTELSAFTAPSRASQQVAEQGSPEPVEPEALEDEGLETVLLPTTRSHPSSCGPLSPVGSGAGVTPLPKTPLPSILEVRQRTEGNSEIYAFYLQVLPLLRGITIAALRRPRQHFEAKHLFLSCDLQRLELWPASEQHVLSAVRGPKKIPETFLRVECVTRIYIPKTTLVTVEQAILFPEALEHEGYSSSVSTSVNGQKKKGPMGPACFPFDLMLNSLEPWHLATPDVQSFHIVTTAIGALLASKSHLQHYSITLGLGTVRSVA